MDQTDRRITRIDAPQVPLGIRRVWVPALSFLPVMSGHGGLVRQFRAVRETLEDLRAQNTWLRTIAIVSSNDGEGKSFVAANLAISLARKKHTRVLLIDGDLGSGRLHDAFGTSNDDGLAQYWSGERRLYDIVQHGMGTQDTELPSILSRLAFISSGAGGDDHGIADMDLLSSMLDTLGKDYEWIVIDTPSIIDGHDSASIARICHGSIFVVRESVTQFEAAESALRQVGNVIGVIVNGVAGSKQ